jgi:hypothetical protein
MTPEIAAGLRINFFVMYAIVTISDPMLSLDGTKVNLLAGKNQCRCTPLLNIALG